MESKTSAINIQIDSNVKKDATLVLTELGLSMSSAINLFLRAVIWHNGIPFSLEIPNKKTLKVFKEVDEEIASGHVKGKRYKSVDELRKDLDI